MAVETLHKQYKAWSSRWKKCRDALSGEHTVHEAGELYLPVLTDELPNEYKARVQRTHFFGASRRTLDGFVGMVFRRAPIVTVPPALDAYLADVTLSGVSFGLFAQNAVEEALSVGRLGILVDFPQKDDDDADEPVTIATAEASGMRPTMQMYLGETIINWREQTDDNKTRLVMVVLTETATSFPDNEFEAKEVTQYRVLDVLTGVYRIRLFEVRDNVDVQIGSDMFPEMNGKTLTDIPFFFVSWKDNRPGVQQPPMLPLVEANFHHYLVQADRSHARHFNALPTPVITGYQKQPGDGDVRIGSQAFLMLPDPTSQAFYMETDGNGLEAMTKELGGLEAAMAVLGARMLEEQKRQVESAEAAGIHRSGEHSVLSAAASAIEQGLQFALERFAEWAGVTGEITISLNKDFVAPGLDPLALSAILAAWQKEALSDETLFEYLQRIELVEETDTFEDWIAEIAASRKKVDATPPATAKPPPQPKGK